MLRRGTNMTQSGSRQNPRRSPDGNYSEKKKVIMLLCMVGVMVVVWFVVLVGPSALIGGGTEIETPEDAAPTTATPQNRESPGGAMTLTTEAGKEIEIPSIETVDDLLAQSRPSEPVVPQADRNPFAVPWKSETEKAEAADNRDENGEEDGGGTGQTGPTPDEVEEQRERLRGRLSVSTIISGGRDPVAVINGQAVTSGDPIKNVQEGVRVLRISKSAVLISFLYDKEEYELTLQLKEK
jgi:hypothetical protein